MKRRWSPAAGLIPAMVCGVSLSLATSASAHIHLVAPLVKNDNGGDEKQIPCDGPRGSTVFTFEPGAFITITVDEYVPHDSYFRIAFDDDGQDFLNPVSIDPINPNRVAQGGSGQARADNPKCLADPADKCGESDFCSQPNKGAIILYDNIDPHLGSASASMYSWTIQLPNVECENCTLQVIQVMEDIAAGFHGPFDNKSDMYHRCLDIQLKKGAGTAGPGNAQGPAKVGKEPAMVCASAVDPGTAGAGGSGTAGASSTAGTSGADGAAGTASAQAGSSAAGATAASGAGGSTAPVAGSAGKGASAAGSSASAAAGSNSARAGVGAVASPTGAAGGPATSRPAGAAGSPSTAAAAGAAVSGTAGSPAPASDSGCSVSSVGGSRQDHAAWLAAVLGALVLASRAKRRRTRH